MFQVNLASLVDMIDGIVLLDRLIISNGSYLWILVWFGVVVLVVVG